jgi:hypothetical protein
MQDTAIKAGTPAPGTSALGGSANGSPAPTITPAIRKEPSVPYKILVFCASLRITVVLFILAFLLVFYGTWAQVDAGIWTVVNKYFRGWGFTSIPLKLIFMRAFDIPDAYAIPFPRGYTLGALLLLNLLAAHAVRFKLSWKRSGILVLHFGIILMMIGEFIAGNFAIEGRMPIYEGYASDYVESDRATELVVVDRSDTKIDEEIVVPASLLRQGAVIRDGALPCDVEVIQFMLNSSFEPVDNRKNLATVGIGLQKIAVEKGEMAGADPNQTVEVASAYVNLKKKGTGEPLGVYLLSTWFTFLHCPPQTVTVDGKKYEVYLRPKRSYRDYQIFLKKFDHDVYPGTTKPRNYSSEITLVDPEHQENRGVKIWMNHPLRYGGETFYQSGLHPFAKGTILQVVRNPGWLLPYISCGLVALGMMVHFGFHLVEFLRRKLA